MLVGFGRRWNDGRFGLVHHEQISSALAAIAKPLFEQSVRRWRRNLKPHAPFEIGLRLLSPTGEPACSGWVDNSGAFAVLSVAREAPAVVSTTPDGERCMHWT